MFCQYVERYLAQIHVGANTGCRPDTDPAVYFAHQKFRHLFWTQRVSLQIAGDIDEDLVYRIDMHILRSYIVEVDLVDLCSVIYVQLHPRRRHNVFKALRYLEDSRPAADPARTKRRRDRKTDGLVAPRRISHNEISRHRIESALDAFDRSIE